MIDFVDAEREAVLTVFGGQFAFQRVNFLDHVVEPLEKCDVIEVFRTKAGDRLAGKPAALVVGVKNFEVAAFDFDDQPQLLGQLKLVFVILRSAINEITDVDGVWLNTVLLSSVDGAHEFGYRLQVDMSILATRRAVGIAPHLECAERHSESVVNKEASD